MAIARPLLNPPITEALVDIRAAATRPPEKTAFGPLVRDKYPGLRVIHTIKAGLTVEHGAAEPVATATAADEGLLGFQCFSEDKRSIAQFRVDGFTFNRLRPYTSGDELLAEALRLWRIFVDLVAPAGVSRVALRYINHLTFPADRLPEYLQAPPVPPDGAGRLVQGFLNRIQAHDPETGLTVIRTLASAKASPDTQGFGVILDVDAFRQADSSVEEAELRPVLEALRTLKNQVFFGSITDLAVEFLNEHGHVVRVD